MTYDNPLQGAVLVRRYKRFLADVELPDGATVTAWCPNPGSMKSCLAERAPVRVAHVDDPKRKLKWTLEQIQVDGTWIMVHPARANAVVGEALQAGAIPELSGYDEIRPEQKYGSQNSRIDFLLEGEGKAFVEVKNVTLREGGAALFPDSVSKRGTRHLEELIEVVADGHRGVMLYCVARADAEVVQPADAIDPTYGETLRKALDAGVEAIAYRCEVRPTGLVLGDRLPVEV